MITIADLYEVHREDMDKQHAQIHSCLSELARIMYSTDRIALSRKLQILIHYVEMHFADEQQFMNACEYPEREEHAADHARIIEMLRDFEALLMTRNEDFSEAHLGELSFLLEQHSSNTDRCYRDFCTRNSSRPLKPL